MLRTERLLHPGLMPLVCVATGPPGHVAARDVGLSDVEYLQDVATQVNERAVDLVLDPRCVRGVLFISSHKGSSQGFVLCNHKPVLLLHLLESRPQCSSHRDLHRPAIIRDTPTCELHSSGKMPLLCHERRMFRSGMVWQRRRSRHDALKVHASASLHHSVGTAAMRHVTLCIAVDLGQ